ncbi:MAG: HDIG domain-containing protein [Candidatus Omnitrophica bacterium]|nr:HDIG domain-containing protein [Candidatus Omnitrophota bacterium]
MKPNLLISNFLNKFFIIFLIILFFILHVDILKLNPLIVIFVISVGAYFIFREKSGRKLTGKIPHLILLYLLFLFISDTLLRNNKPLYFIPFSLISMLTTIVFSDLEMSLLMSMMLGVTFGFQTDNFFWGVVLFNSAIFSSLMSWKVRRRFQVIRAGMVAGLVQVVSILFLKKFVMGDPLIYIWFFLNGCVCGIVISGVLPLFEYLFDRITNITLLELSDFDNPLLREMILKAPGTYHHSLIVGNLAEAASEAIGADALLSRIGAYYHDIGKINKPMYFIENQTLGKNSYDNLSPSLSKLIIINHVKEGAALARRYKLNEKIIDFILQHHGTSLVYYFYLKALQDMKDERIDDDFRYPGPKPKTKETAVVLLADSVEAASRTMRQPTPTKIAELVHRIINNKFIDGQLDECELTLKDLEKIAGVFIKILTSMYHARITYPKK